MDNRPPPITLMTDFGTEDVYVGVMKGVIAGIAPDARVIDLTHAVGDFNIVEAAFRIRQAHPWFPEGTIHVIVVDPGVGGERRAVAMRAGGHVFVAPDNGVLSSIDADKGHDELVELTNPGFFLPDVSATFHGRDIFAPVAAHIANGTALSELGPALECIQRAPVPEPSMSSDGRIVGTVLWADRFGNLVTNIPSPMLGNGVVERIEVNDRAIGGLSRTFGDVDAGNWVAMIGSFGMLEIGVNLGNAAERLGQGTGAVVTVVKNRRMKDEG